MISIEPFVWKDLQKTVSMTKLLKCESRTKQEVTEPFYMKVRNSFIFIYLYLQLEDSFLLYLSLSS